MAARKLKIWDWAPRDWERYDLGLVLPLDASFRLQPAAVAVLKALCKLLGRRYIYAFYSEDSTRIYVLIRTRLKLLRAKANTEGWTLRLDEELCQAMAYTGIESDLVTSFAVPHRPNITFFPPFKYIYARYVADESADQLYQRSHGMRHPFAKPLRLQMLTDFLQRRPSTEIELAPDYLVESGVALDCFAVHDLPQRAQLVSSWLSCCPARLPLDALQDYFGSKIGFYFSFLDYLFYWALLPAAIGIACEVPAVLYNNFSRSEIPTFAFFTSIYAVVGGQYWKRRQQLLATQWNSLGSEAREREAAHPRFRFSGQLLTSCVDGREVVHYSSRARAGWYLFSLLVCALCVAVALAGQAAIYFARWQLYYTSVAPYAQWVAGGGSALQVAVLGRVFFAVAEWLTGLENHRREIEHEHALIAKVFLFQMLNALAPFYYLAFVARYIHKHKQTSDSLGECGFDSCMQALAINVTAVTGCIVLQRAAHFLAPWLSFRTLAQCCGRYQGQRYSEAMQPIVDSEQPMSDGDASFLAADEKQDEHYDAEAFNYDHAHPQPDSFDEDDLGPGDENTLASYLQRQHSTVMIKERALAGSPGVAERRGPEGGAPSPQKSRFQVATDEDEEDDDDNVSCEYVENPFVFPRATMDSRRELVRGYSHAFSLLAVAMCFGAALPAVYAMLAVYLALEARGQGWQLLHLYPRGLPLAADGMGPWVTFWDVLQVTATLTNTSLTILTMDQFLGWNLSHRLLLWIGAVGAVLLTQLLLHLVWSRLPEETVIQRQRTHFITKKLIERLPDQEDTFPVDML